MPDVWERTDRILGWATLRETRHRLRTWRGAASVAGIAVAFAVVSMLLGQMLVLTSDPGPYFVTIVHGGASQWWLYPGLLVIQPWGTLELAFFPTIAMVLVSIGVGFGGATGISLVAPLLRRGTSRVAGPAAGVAAGVGPAITGLATLGACCCTTCAGAVGVSVVAAVSGASLFDLLVNNWYIGMFQIAVVYVSLLAQERVLRTPAEACPVPPPVDARFVTGAVLRAGLLVAGITWSLAMFVEWGDASPLQASSATWYHWIFEHQVLAITAIAAGLFPAEFVAGVRSLTGRISFVPVRLALGLGAITWGIWVPPELTGLGLGGLLNEVLGFTGAPASWGAVTPDASLGAALYFHWAFQHALLAAFGLAIAVRPLRAILPLAWTTSPERPGVAGPADLPQGPSESSRRSAPAAPTFSARPDDAAEPRVSSV